ncbi:NHL repeat protein [compost metagenome]
MLWGIGQGSRWTSPTGTASSAAHNGLNFPHHARFDAAGNVWISDTSNHRILKYDPNGNFLRGIGGGVTWTTGAGNTVATAATDGSFAAVMGVAPAPNGDLYVADRGNNRIQVFDANGVFLRKWGVAGPAPGQLDGPEDVLVDHAGHVWVAESSASRIQKFDRFGTLIGAYGGPGTGNGQFANARGLAYAPDGAILVGDDNNHRVQRLLPANSLALRREGMLKKGAGTVSFWVKPTWPGNSPQRNYLVEFDDPAVGVQNEVVSLFKENGTLILWYRVGGQPQQTPSASVSHWKANEWHHVAFTWSAAKVALYLDGALAASVVPNAVLNEDPLDLYVGRNFGGGVTNLEGTIDQFRTYDDARTAAEIARDARGLSQE